MAIAAVQKWALGRCKDVPPPIPSLCFGLTPVPTAQDSFCSESSRIGFTALKIAV